MVFEDEQDFSCQGNKMLTGYSLMFRLQNGYRLDEDSSLFDKKYIEDCLTLCKKRKHIATFM